MIIAYDIASLASPGDCCAHALRDQLRAAPEFEPGQVLGVTVSTDRIEGQEIEVEYANPPSGEQSTAALNTVSAHDGSASVPAQTLMTSADLTGEIPPGARCLIHTAIGQAERTLPEVAKASGEIIMHCSGANNLVIKPHATEQGSVTVDGAASVTMGNGDAAVFGVDETGNWINLGPKAPT